MALSKDIDEIHAMPYPRYKSWQLFYMLEPWGWLEDEYRNSAIIAMLHNTHASKGVGKKPTDYMRNTADGILKHLAPEPDLSELSEEARRELVKQSMKDFFGA